MIDSKNMVLKIGEQLAKNDIPFVTGLTTDDLEPIPAATTETAELSAEAQLILKEIEESVRKVFESHLDKPSKPVTLGFTVPTAIPFRKNKRKRIQKKWNKKYGFIVKSVVMRDFKIVKKSDGDFYEFEAVKEI